MLGLTMFFRLWRIIHDLPYKNNPDEKHSVNRSLAVDVEDLNKHCFNKPAFQMYLLFLEYGLYSTRAT